MDEAGASYGVDVVGCAGGYSDQVVGVAAWRSGAGGKAGGWDDRPRRAVEVLDQAVRVLGRLGLAGHVEADRPYVGGRERGDGGEFRVAGCGREGARHAGPRGAVPVF